MYFNALSVFQGISEYVMAFQEVSEPFQKKPLEVSDMPQDTPELFMALYSCTI